MWLCILWRHTHKKVTIHVLVPENVTRVNSGSESAPKGHSCSSGRSEVKPHLEGWYGSQVSEDTRTTFPRTQQVLPKIIGHTHYQVTVIFNEFAKTATYISPEAQARTHKHSCAPLCLWFWWLGIILGRGGNYFALYSWLCLCNFKTPLKNGRGGWVQ